MHPQRKREEIQRRDNHQITTKNKQGFEIIAAAPSACLFFRNLAAGMGILSKNLVKSLSNFRFVCRNSYSINPSLYIPRRHHNLEIDDYDNNNLNLLLKRFDGNRIEYFSVLSTEKGKNFSPKYNIYLPFSKINRHPQFLAGTCNEFMCLDDMLGNIVIWNPATNEFKFLPQSPEQRPGDDVYSYSCFWFDPKSKDYKVLRFFHTPLEDEEGAYLGSNSHVEMYSLNSDSWKEISDLGVSPDYSYSSAFVNGSYYWIHSWGTADDFILSFDTANEKFSTLPLPDIGGSLFAPYALDLLEFDGLLGALVYSIVETEKSFDLWVMNGSWTWESNIHVSGAERPLRFWRKGELFFEGLNHELMVIDRATGELKNLGIYSYPRTMQLIPYAERLVHSMENQSSTNK